MSRNNRHSRRSREAPIFSSVILGMLMFFLGAFSYGAYRLDEKPVMFWSLTATLVCATVLVLINTNHSHEED